MKKTKLLAVLSTAAISSLMISAVAFAADGDVYDLNTHNKKYSSDVYGNNMSEMKKFMNDMMLHKSKLGYEYNGKVYVGKDTLAKNTNTPDEFFGYMTELSKDGSVKSFDVKEFNAGLSVESVTAITDSKLKVKFSKPVDSADKENFSIQGMSVIAAQISDDKKEATVIVKDAQLGSRYSLAVKNIKINGEIQKDTIHEFEMPQATSLYHAKLSIDGNKTSLKADNASSVLVTFELTDSEGNIIDADNVEVAFTSTFGNFAEKRVTVQKGKASALFNSEVLNSDKNALLSATIVEASNKNLINIKDERNLLLTPNPESQADEKVGATLTDVSAKMADRVTLYFNKEVDVAKYVAENTKAGYDASKLEITIKDNVDNNDTGVEAGDGKQIIHPVGLKKVPGNSKALYAILPTNTVLTDNSRLNVQVKDLTSNIATEKILSTVLTDARKPSILGVERNGLNEIVLTFSEPVISGVTNDSATKLENWVLDGVKLDDSKWGVTATKATVEVGTFDEHDGNDNRNIVTIKLGKDAEGKQIYFKSGDHSIQGANIGDWANKTDGGNNVINTETLDFNVPEDNTAPIAKVEVQSPEQYIVTFDKAINEEVADLQNAIKLQKFDKVNKKWIDETKQSIQVRQGSKSNEFIVETTKDWTAIDVYNTKVSHENYYNDNYKLFIDAGKVTAAANGKTNSKMDLLLDSSIMKNADVESPKIIKGGIIEVVEGKEYKVIMSEPVKFPVGGDNLTTLAQGQDSIPTPTAQFIKADGSKTIEGTVTVGTDAYNKELKVIPTGGVKLDAGEWTLVVRSISDDVGNTAASAKENFTVKADAVVEVEKDFKVVWAGADSDNDYTNGLTEVVNDNGNDAIFVKFSQAIKTTGGHISALNTANYTLNGEALPKGTQIVANIKGYDNKDNVTDSVTIILPDGTLNKIDSTVVTISSYIQNNEEKSLSNGGQFKLAYNHATRTVTTLDQLNAAMADNSVREITLGNDINGNIKLGRLVKLDLGTHTLTGNIEVTTDETGKSSIENGTVTGTLTVDTKNADFEVKAGGIISGTTTIKNVLNATFVNNGTLNNVVIADADGTSFENKATINGKVTINTAAAVKLDGEIANVEVNKAANIVLAKTANVQNLDLKAESKGVTIKGNESSKVKVKNETGEEVSVTLGKEVTKVANGAEVEVKKAPTKVTLNGDVGTADNAKITGLTSGKKYVVTVDGAKQGVKADGTLGAEGEAAALTGTEITGLDNTKTYTVEEVKAVAPTKVTLNGGVGTADNAKITGLTSGKKYVVTVDGAKQGVKADGTLGAEGEAAALTGTEITGLDNAKTYTVEEVKAVAPTKVTLNGGVGTADNAKITGLTSGKKYVVTVDGAKQGVKADGTLGAEGEAAALTGTEITGLDNAKTYTVEEV